MLTLELAPLFRNIVTVPQRDDQRLCQVSRFGLRALPWSVLFRNLIYYDPRTDENRLQHDVWISCPRNIHLPRDELDSDQSVLWFKLPGFCTHCLRSPDSLRIANTTHPQDVAEQVFSALYTYFSQLNANITKISPTMGPPLMLVFCVATNFLLLTILICLLSKSYDKV